MKQLIRRLMQIALLFSPTLALAIDPADVLDVDDAFRITTLEADGRGNINVGWEIAEGYYLYGHRFGFSSQTSGVSLGEAVLPVGEQYEDEFFGKVETHRQQVAATIPYAGSADQLDLLVRFQGCADVGLCYPPQTKTLTVALASVAPLSDPIVEPSVSSYAGGTLQALGLGDDGFNAAPVETALPVDEAFKFEAIAMSATDIVARFTIADGYYMYRDHFSFELARGAGASLGAPVLPAGEPKLDPEFGNVDVYFGGEVEVSIPLLRHALDAENILLRGNYQGCKDGAICYPPETRLLAVALPQFAGPVVPVPEASDEPAVSGADLQRTGDGNKGALASLFAMLSPSGLSSTLDGGNLFFVVLIFLIGGIALAFTPCVYPSIPILSSIIAGEEKTNTRRAFFLSSAFVAAMVLVYAVAGIITAEIGQSVQTYFQNIWVIGALCIVLIVMALSMFGFYEIQMPGSWQTRLNAIGGRQRSGTMIGAFVMGAVSALVVGACASGLLVAAVGYIAQTGDKVVGAIAMGALGLGQGIPLLIFGVTEGALLPKAGNWMSAVKSVFGVALLALAIWMLERVANPTVIMLLWGLLLIASGVYLGAFERIEPGRSGWFKLWKALGLVAVLFGAAQLAGAAAGGNDWLQPLKPFKGGGTAPAPATVTFNKIKSLEQLRTRLAASDQPAMLDFYADWCVDCKRMDKYTFPTPAVQAAMADGLVFKADVTANDTIDQALMREFNVIGPPMILFFDAAGNEMREFRVVGFQSADTFSQHVQRAFEAGKQ